VYFQKPKETAVQVFDYEFKFNTNLKVNNEDIKKISDNYQNLTQNDKNDTWTNFRIGYIAGSIVSMISKSKLTFGCFTETEKKSRSLMFTQLKSNEKKLIFSENHIEVVSSFLDFCKSLVYQILGNDAKLLQDYWIASENAMNEIKSNLMKNIDNQKFLEQHKI